QVFDAVRFCQQLPTVKRVDVNLGGGSLVAADEMARQTDAGDGQLEPASKQKINRAEADRIPRALIDDAIQKTVFRVVVVCFVGRKFEFLEEIMICGADDVLDISGEIDA